jgi:hypothetical protein
VGHAGVSSSGGALADRAGHSPGVQASPGASALEPAPAVSLADAAAYFQKQVAPIRSGEQMTQKCLIDGPYAHEEWVYIHLRYAELHLGFLAIVTE